MIAPVQRILRRAVSPSIFSLNGTGARTILAKYEWWKGVELVASPGELVSKVSDLLGISESTIVQHDRNLVVAGLRSKSGRGTSAARMTPRDAAHLLVAVLGSHHVKDSAQTVRRYSETRLHKTQSEGYADSSVAALMNLQPGHSFVDALEALISAAAEGSLQTAIYEALPESEGKKIGFPPTIEITVRTPQLIGDLSISGIRIFGHGLYCLPEPHDQHQSSHPPAEEVELFERKIEEYRIDTDLTQYRQVSVKTILGIGELLGT